MPHLTLTGASFRAIVSGVAHSCLLHKTGLRRIDEFSSGFKDMISAILHIFLRWQ